MTGYDCFQEYKISYLYSQIQEITNTKYSTLINIFSDVKKPINQRSDSTITFSPPSIRAGSDDILTITGKGFGNFKGSGTVWFYNADNGGRSLTSHSDSIPYISWSDTKITMFVPENAGTGFITVQNDNGDKIKSENMLTVRYAFQSIIYYEGKPYHTILADTNSNGGYTWSITDNFSSINNARDIFIQAVSKWNCIAGVNWDIEYPVLVNSAVIDGINLIKFDDENTLPDGVLGQTITRSSYTIVNRKFILYAEKIDIVFNKNINWYFGTDTPDITQYDFESVVLHELGHAHQLGHVIDLNDMMYWNIENSKTRRDFNQNIQEAAEIIMDESITDNDIILPMTRDLKKECIKFEYVIDILKLLSGEQVEIHSFYDSNNNNKVGLEDAVYFLKLLAN